MFSKPVRPLFIFRKQIKIFLMKSEGSLSLPYIATQLQFSQVQKRRKDIGKIVHVTVIQP